MTFNRRQQDINARIWWNCTKNNFSTNAVIQIGWRVSNLFHRNYVPSTISIKFWLIVHGCSPKSTLRYATIDNIINIFSKHPKKNPTQSLQHKKTTNFGCSFFFLVQPIQKLTKTPNSWSLSEVVHAIVILTHFHSLSSFVFSCGLTQDLDPLSSQRKAAEATAATKPEANGSTTTTTPAKRWSPAQKNSSLLGK